MDIYFWLFAILAGIPLWWFAFYATKRMRIGKNLEREAQAKRNLERFEMEQAAKEQAAKDLPEKQAAEKQQSLEHDAIECFDQTGASGKQE